MTTTSDEVSVRVKESLRKAMAPQRVIAFQARSGSIEAGSPVLNKYADATATLIRFAQSHNYPGCFTDDDFHRLWEELLASAEAMDIILNGFNFFYSWIIFDHGTAEYERLIDTLAISLSSFKGVKNTASDDMMIAPQEMRARVLDASQWRGYLLANNWLTYCCLLQFAGVSHSDINSFSTEVTATVKKDAR